MAAGEAMTDTTKEDEMTLTERLRCYVARAYDVNHPDGWLETITGELMDDLLESANLIDTLRRDVLAVCAHVLQPTNQNLRNGDVVACVRDVATMATMGAQETACLADAKQVERIAALEANLRDTSAREVDYHQRFTDSLTRIAALQAENAHLVKAEELAHEAMHESQARLAALQDALWKVPSPWKHDVGTDDFACRWCSARAHAPRYPTGSRCHPNHPANGCAYTLLTEAGAPRTPEVLTQEWLDRPFATQPAERPVHVCGLHGYQRGSTPDPICPACAEAMAKERE